MTSREIIDGYTNYVKVTPYIDDNAMTVLEARYLLKDENGKIIETPQKMFERVAEAIANAELTYLDIEDIYTEDNFRDKAVLAFYDIMARLDFLPNSPTLMNAGRPLGMLSACFLLELEDSMDSIFQCVKDAAIIQKAGGGTGYVFSNLRPKNSVVKTTMGKSSGPVSFMSVFDAMTDTVRQGGVRRGANMGMLSCDHADIEEFIMCKSDNKSFKNFNISVAITDAFMRRVFNGDDRLFNMICEQAWKTGDPGLFFMDTANVNNPIPAQPYRGTNPCGEQVLTNFESCNLGSINLSHMLDSTDNIWYDKLERTTRLAVRFLDNVIDVNKYPLKEIEHKTKQTRKIGLGVMGFADMCIKKGIVYGGEESISLSHDVNEESVNLAHEVMEFINDIAKDESEALGQERGAFPLFGESIYSQPYETTDTYAIRNATRTTIAPTGTLSIIANCSSGIEPIFAKEYTRKTLDNTILTVKHPLLEAGYDERLFVEAHDIPYKQHIDIQAAFQDHVDNAVSKTINMRSDATVEDVKNAYLYAYNKGCKGITIFRDGCKGEQVLEHKKENKLNESLHRAANLLESNDENFKEICEVASDIAKYATEAGLNPYIHPRKRSLEHKKENKGTEVLKKVLEEVESESFDYQELINPKVKENGYIHPRSRPNCSTGVTEKIKSGCGNIYVTINKDKSGPCETFGVMGKSGGCALSQVEAISRLISLGLRCGIDPIDISEQLIGIRCQNPTWYNGVQVLSCADAIGKVLKKHTNDNKLDKHIDDGIDGIVEEMSNVEVKGDMMGICPECGEIMMHSEGCVICHSCGFSKC